MSVGKSSISRLRASTEANKPEAPEVPAPAVAVPAEQVVKKTAPKSAKKATGTAKPAAKSEKPAKAGEHASTVIAAPAPAVTKSVSSFESYAFGDELPYWLL